MSQKNLRIAWGITGAGDMLPELVEIMKELIKDEIVKIKIFLSKAGKTVIDMYKFWEDLETIGKVTVEKDANTPFLAASLQLRKFDLFLIAPSSCYSPVQVKARADKIGRDLGSLFFSRFTLYPRRTFTAFSNDLVASVYGVLRGNLRAFPKQIWTRPRCGILRFFLKYFSGMAYLALVGCAGLEPATPWLKVRLIFSWILGYLQS